LPYVNQVVRVKGFHLSPFYKYNLYKWDKQQDLTGFYIAGGLDYFYYKKSFEKYDSRNNETEIQNYYSAQLAVGGTVGAQLIAFNRVTISISISMFIKTISYTNNKEKELNSLNSYWVSENNQFWSNYKLMIGYAFGK